MSINEHSRRGFSKLGSTSTVDKFSNETTYDVEDSAEDGRADDEGD
jgi:hypothetical protein